MRATICAAAATLAFTQAGCASLSTHLPLPKSQGEVSTGFGYIPVDGLAVLQAGETDECDARIKKKQAVYGPILQDLPDLSVRFAVGTFEDGGGLNFGPSKVTVNGSTYRAVLDYVNVDVIPAKFYIRKHVDELAKGDDQLEDISYVLRPGDKVISYEAHYFQEWPAAAPDPKDHYQRVVIPVYVGIGMRLSADIRALKGGITLTSLGAIGAEAQANALSGTLTVQTLGVTGRSVATALPMPSKLDQTTIENGILALGSSRAFIYGASQQPGDIETTPRIVGIYSPVGSDPALINSIYSELASAYIYWYRPCHDLPSVQPASDAKP